MDNISFIDLPTETGTETLLSEFSDLEIVLVSFASLNLE